MQEDVGRDNDLHSTVANRIVELAKHDQQKVVIARQPGVAVIAVRSLTCSRGTPPGAPSPKITQHRRKKWANLMKGKVRERGGLL